jgi:hypothetical protein
MQPSIGAIIAATSETGFIDESHKGDEIIAADTTAPVRSAVETKRVLKRSPLLCCIVMSFSSIRISAPRLQHYAP